MTTISDFRITLQDTHITHQKQYHLPRKYEFLNHNKRYKTIRYTEEQQS